MGPAGRPDRHAGAAAGHRCDLPPDGLAGRDGQPDEPRRSGDCTGHGGGCVDHRHREYRPSHGRAAQRDAQPVRDRAGRPGGSGPAGSVLGPDHGHRVPAAVLAAVAGRQDVQAPDADDLLYAAVLAGGVPDGDSRPGFDGHEARAPGRT